MRDYFFKYSIFIAAAVFIVAAISVAGTALGEGFVRYDGVRSLMSLEDGLVIARGGCRPPEGGDANNAIDARSENECVKRGGIWGRFGGLKFGGTPQQDEPMPADGGIALDGSVLYVHKALGLCNGYDGSFGGCQAYLGLDQSNFLETYSLEGFAGQDQELNISTSAGDIVASGNMVRIDGTVTNQRTITIGSGVAAPDAIGGIGVQNVSTGTIGNDGQISFTSPVEIKGKVLWPVPVEINYSTLPSVPPSL